MWPHATNTSRRCRCLFVPLEASAFTHGGAYYTTDLAGAALWLPPGVHPDGGALDELMKSTASAAARDEGPAIFEQMTKYHPTEPHWYLPLIGVDPRIKAKVTATR